MGTGGAWLVTGVQGRGGGGRGEGAEAGFSCCCRCRNPRAELANSRASATEPSWRENLGTKDVLFFLLGPLGPLGNAGHADGNQGLPSAPRRLHLTLPGISVESLQLRREETGASTAEPRLGLG